MLRVSMLLWSKDQIFDLFEVGEGLLLSKFEMYKQKE